MYILFIYLINLINYLFILFFVRCSWSLMTIRSSMQTETFFDRHIPVSPHEKMVHQFLATPPQSLNNRNSLTTFSKILPDFEYEKRYNIIS